jgi:serine/threonine-protein kinase
MAPEQANGETNKVDPQTDLWSVGATLFSLITGELVHRGDNSQQMMVNAATQRARRLSSIAHEAPPQLGEVIDKALAFDKADRWSSAAEMREALAKACGESSGPSVAPLPRSTLASGVGATFRTPPQKDPRSGGAAQLTPPGTDPTALAHAPDPSRNTPPSRLPQIGLALAMGATLVVAVFWGRGRAAPQEVPTPAPPIKVSEPQPVLPAPTPLNVEPRVATASPADAGAREPFAIDSGEKLSHQKRPGPSTRGAEGTVGRKIVEPAVASHTSAGGPAPVPGPAATPPPLPADTRPLGMLQISGSPPVPLTSSQGTVALPAKSFKITLDYQIAEGSLVATLSATPWAIVYVNGKSSGNSREKPVALPQIGTTPVRLELEHPDRAGEKLVLTYEDRPGEGH